MSRTTSETNSVTRAANPGSTRFSNSSALNINSGTGTQTNYHQTGAGNTQYNAHTQTFYHTTPPPKEEEKASACLNALISIRPEDHRAAIISAKGDRVDGTCEWVKKNSEYKSLLCGETQLLWIRGGPGKGKTMLSIFLTQDLAKNQKVAYFFCQADDETRRCATYVLRSLIWQLAVQQPAIAEHLTHYLYPPGAKQAVLTSRETLWSIFSKLVQDPRLSTVFCLLGGLDECDDDSRRWLASALVNLCSTHESRSGPHPLRILIVSRPNIWALGDSKCITLDPDNSERVSWDISTFIDTKVEELSDRLVITPDEDRATFKSRMYAELLKRANGTFLWVGFATIELLKKNTWTEMEVALHELPIGLPALYDRMLLQIDPCQWLTSSKILRWVAMAFRPLHVNQLAAIVDRQHHDSIPAEQHILDQLTICGSFVLISNKSVRLIHESAREYLLRAHDHKIVALREIHVDPSRVHLEMAATCITSIENEYAKRKTGARSAPTPRFGVSTSQDTLHDYARYHWPEHARWSGEALTRLVEDSPSFFSTKSRSRSWWWRKTATWRVVRLVDNDLTILLTMDDVPALHIACYLGLTPWVAKLLLSARNPPHGTRPYSRIYPLHLRSLDAAATAERLEHSLQSQRTSAA